MSLLDRALAYAGLDSPLAALAGRARYAGLSYVVAGAVVATASLGVLLTTTPAGRVLQEAAGSAVQTLASLGAPMPAGTTVASSAPVALAATVQPRPAESATPAASANAVVAAPPRATTTPEPPSPMATPMLAASTHVPAAVPAGPPVATATPYVPAQPAAAAPRSQPQEPPPTIPPPPTATAIVPTLTSLPTLHPTLTSVPSGLATVTAVVGTLVQTVISKPSATSTPAPTRVEYVEPLLGTVSSLLQVPASTPAPSASSKPASGGLLSTLTHL